MSDYLVPYINQIAKKEIIKVNVPGSKSITNRALLLAALADGRSSLRGVLFSEDSIHFLDCITKLGIESKIDTANKTINILGCNNKLPNSASLYVGSAGTAARFLTATLGVAHGTFELDASKQMCKRPMLPLLKSLESIGCQISYKENEGHFPFTLNSNGFMKNDIDININDSSQFLSGLLIASVLSENDTTINISGSHGLLYVDMTAKMMKQFGVDIDVIDNASTVQYKIKGNQHYVSNSYDIEPDASAAAYFYAAGAILGIPVCIPGIKASSMQGDVQFLKCLESMGCKVDENQEGLILIPSNEGLHGINIDMSAFSDQAITLAVVATYADSPTTITGIGHIRLQESDRLSAISNELNKCGIKTECGNDYIVIYPGKANSATIETYEDHRIAMGFSLLGLKNPGITISNPGCCAKTFENYFEVFDSFIKEAQKGVTMDQI